ncbi:Phage-related holin (Lysis protein),toxin secretion/phage lysis holin,Holin family [[Clostridium] sordellii]|uniref:phage holin family protein n=1 Tax=Paraclostridium sordellii TaxID=1505 RepID=UPI0005430850|nr:phage holin family protein [Paeniclostridium sordellii]CEK35779.1 Phage-related holin (Lysis protein),toxin secretion/phage lysis holin,Holin family [[Clostridium] sordellii] [Paeniclostridium sordellii]
MFKFIPEAISWLLVLYLAFKFIDVSLGILKTLKKDNYKSSKMRDGLIRFISELLGITFVLVLDIFLNLKFALAGVTIALFAYKEAGSILENLGECGVTLPDAVADKLEVLNQNKEKDKENK